MSAFEITVLTVVGVGFFALILWVQIHSVNDDSDIEDRPAEDGSDD